MAIYSLFSASGAPGVTTTAVALAMSWPRHVILVDANAAATQSISAGYLRSLLPHEKGVMELAAAARNHQLDNTLPSTLIHLEGSNADFMQGPRSPLQARTMSVLWPALLEKFIALDSAGTDVIVDLGRLGTEHFAMPLLQLSNRAVLVMRSDLPSIVGANWHAAQLVEQFEGAEEAGRMLKLAVVGQGQPYSASDIGKKLGIRNPINIGFDAATAAHFSIGSALPKRRVGSSTLLRSIDAMGAALRANSNLPVEDDDE